MDVTFSYTSEEYRTLRRLRPYWRWQGPMVATVAPLPAVTLSLIFGTWLDVVLVGLGSLLLLGLLLRKSLRVAQSIPARLVGPHHLSIRPDGVFAHNQWAWSWRSWNQMRGPLSLSDHVILACDWRTMHVIPRSAFASPGEADEFARQAQQWWEAARQSNAVDAEPPNDLPPGPPDPPRVSVEFTYEGNVVPQSPRSYLTRFVVMALCGVALVLQNPLFPAFLVIFHGLVGSLLTIMTAELSFVLWDQWGLRRYGRQDIGRRTLHLHHSGMMLVAPGQLAFVRWSGISAVEQFPSFVALFLERPMIHTILPNREFQSEGERQHFVQVVKDNLSQAEAVDVVAEVIEGPGETGNPYQSPQG